jgi:hypothetical protein
MMGLDIWETGMIGREIPTSELNVLNDLGHSEEKRIGKRTVRNFACGNHGTKTDFGLLLSNQDIKCAPWHFIYRGRDCKYTIVCM